MRTLFRALLLTVVVSPAFAADPPAKAKLAVTVAGSLDATTGRKFNLRVTAAPAGATVAIHDAPRGVALADGSITWTPTDAQVGTHNLMLKVSEDDDEKVSEWAIVVRPPSVRLPGIGMQMAVAADGKSAAVVSVDRPVNGFGGNGTWKITLVDLPTMKILGDAPAIENAQVVAVDAHHVYLAGNNEVVVFRRKDMSVAKRLPVAGQSSSLAAVADRWLFVSHGGKSSVFAVPDLTPADPAAVGNGVHLSGRGEALIQLLPQRTTGGWLYDGIEYDPTFTKMRGVLRPRGVAQAVGSNATTNSISWVGPGYTADQYHHGYPNQYGNYLLLPLWLGPWGVTVSQPSTLQQNKRTIQLPLEQPNPSGIAYTATTVLPDRPAVASVRYQNMQTDFNRSSRVRAELVYHDLASMSVVRRQTLLEETVPPNAFIYGGLQPKLEARDGVLFCLFADRLLAVPTPKLSARAAAPVPYFDAVSLPLILGDKDVTAKLPPVKGVKELAGYDTEVVQSGVSVEGDRITLKAEPIHKRLTDGLVTTLSNLRIPNTGVPRVPTDSLAEYLKIAAPVFEKLAGRKPTGTPVWMTIDIVARDKNTDRADGQIGVLVDVPAAPVLDRAKTVYEAALVRSRPPATTDPRVPELLRAQQAYQTRMTDLEKKLEDSNAKLDRLLKLLEPKKE